MSARNRTWTANRILVMAEERIVHETPDVGTYRHLSEEILHATV